MTKLEAEVATIMAKLGAPTTKHWLILAGCWAALLAVAVVWNYGAHKHDPED